MAFTVIVRKGKKDVVTVYVEIALFLSSIVVSLLSLVIGYFISFSVKRKLSFNSFLALLLNINRPAKRTGRGGPALWHS